MIETCLDAMKQNVKEKKQYRLENERRRFLRAGSFQMVIVKSLYGIIVSLNVIHLLLTSQMNTMNVTFVNL